MYPKKKNKEDVLYILEHLREEDKHEAIVQKGENYVQECLKDIMDSDDFMIIGCKKSDNTPVCMGGIAKTNEKGIGVVWLLSTPEVVKYQICLLRNIKAELKKFDNEYWLMFNIIFKENELAKKWLSKFGFRFENPFGLNIPEGFEFFYKKREVRGLN